MYLRLVCLSENKEENYFLQTEHKAEKGACKTEVDLNYILKNVKHYNYVADNNPVYRL